MTRFTPKFACAALLSLVAGAAGAASLQSGVATLASHFAPMSASTVQQVPLKDGFTLHEYQDGKMAVENPYGRPVMVPDGHLLTAADGSTMRMRGDEVARLAAEIHTRNHR